MKILLATLVLVILGISTPQVLTYSDVFINKGNYHIEALTLDFLMNIAFEDKVGFIGENNITDVILDADKIPNKQLATWKNKYGYFGSAAFHGEKIIDGMNTQGLAVSINFMAPNSTYLKLQVSLTDPKNIKKIVSAKAIHLPVEKKKR